ncbi:MAG: S4 domain-containing protein YaaA [Streptococcaceae bacterium]|jgi:S4 domain protein YaaA|nr:S4 domain-containing protein YaaA [Streptococcaceae bacterium]
METITIFKDYITLGQSLKELGLIQTGGQAKSFLAENAEHIFYNGEQENRRGKKIYPGDRLELPEFDMTVQFVQADAEELAEREQIKQLEKNFKIKEQLNAEKQVKAGKPRSPFHR